MPHRAPTPSEVAAIARELGLHLQPGDAEEYAGLLAAFPAAMDAMDGLGDALPAAPGGRDPGHRPADAENPLGAWYVKTEVPGAAGGRLSGRRIALKDNVMLAGVPMMNGSVLLEGTVPPVDATIVTRMLAAGGSIAGKAVCESWCLSAGSHTADSGPVRNPHDPSRTAGGSSSGSAALVAAGEVDMAIGGDQGGSIRIPAAYCGIVGMKPTHGLVPYTGILPLEPSLDHTGPMTATVAENARLLEVLAGPDGIDARQAGHTPAEGEYTARLGEPVSGMRLGLLREGFDAPGTDPAVRDAVRAAARRLEALGARCTEVSVPLHRLSGALMLPLFQSGLHGLFVTEGTFPGHEDLYVPALCERLRGWRARADELPETVKLLLLGSEHLRRTEGWTGYARATQLRRRLRAAYDEALAGLDALVLPTVPQVAPPLPPPDARRAETLARAFAGVTHTQAFDLSHHPALQVPCGTAHGLPVGMMLVGRPYAEATLYHIAHALETAR